MYAKPHIMLLDIIAADIRPLKLAIVALMVLAFGGFLSIALGAPAGDIAWAVEMFPAWVWATAFIVCATMRTIRMFFWRGHASLTILIPLLAIWIWAMLFASSYVMQDGTPLAVLYLMPAIIETWILARALDDRMSK